MSPEQEIAAAAELDRSGFLPLPGESATAFLDRFLLSEEAFAKFEEELKTAGTARLFDDFTVRESDRIPAEMMDEAAAKTRELYGFENRRVPGFFLSGKVGPLWGGCMIGDPDNGFAVMLLRGAFRERARWYVYERSELVAHELCHAMRQSLSEVKLEEFFAYQTGESFLRRTFGNCFIRERDALLFILPAFLLLGATMVREFGGGTFPLWPFWALAGCYPLFLLIRNFLSMRTVRRAEKKLRSFGVERPEPVLFRSTFEELRAIGALPDRAAFRDFLDTMRRTELRWAIMGINFFDQWEKRQ